MNQHPLGAEMSDQPIYYLAEYEGAEPALFSTAELAREYCDDFARAEADGRCWDWMPENEYGVQEQCWTDEDTDRPTWETGGVVLALRLDAETGSEPDR